MMSAPLVHIKNLGKTFPIGRTRKDAFQALQSVSFSIYPGEILGIIGESGAGKSTLGRILAFHATPSEGDVVWPGETDLHKADLRSSLRRARLAQMILQNAFLSFNPRQTIANAICEAPQVHGMIRAQEKETFLASWLKRLNLDARFKDARPHELSGGQLTRVSIARALSLSPRLVVCDEPTMGLDAPVQAQILNLFLTLQQETNASYVFISHDLSVIRHLCDRIIVMRSGEILEQSDAKMFFLAPQSAYGRQLIETCAPFTSES